MIPDDIPEKTIQLAQDEITIPQLLKQIDYVASTSEAIRLISGGGIKIDGEKVDDPKKNIRNLNKFVIQVGKRKFARIIFT